jgi:molybdate transport system regulatory protein
LTIEHSMLIGSVNVRYPANACLKGRRLVKHLSGGMKTRSERPDTRIRILAGSEIALGPGKADLLRAIDETGSISAAARRMRMSYRRAWLLVHTMNECFDPPLVEAVKGGPEGGGAQLTPTGRRVMAEYSRVLQVATERIGPFLRRRK